MKFLVVAKDQTTFLDSKWPSGLGLMGEQQYGIDSEKVTSVAEDIAKVHNNKKVSME